jgi:hypothetical protein
MPRKLNLSIGSTVKLLTVLSFKPSQKGTIATCRCQCGATHEVLAFLVAAGKAGSCGCLKYQRGRINVLHGKSRTKVHNTWCEMLSRITNPKDGRYADYGGRGLTVSEDWKIFTNFYRDMGDPPSLSHSLDRIDNEKGYSKDNCRWATAKEQARNTRTNVVVLYEGRKICLTEAAEIAGQQYKKTHLRLSRYGWSLSKALGEEFTWPEDKNPYQSDS